MKESELFLPIKDWFKNKGYKVYTEIASTVASRSIDVVAQNEKEIIVLELKLGLTKKVIRQSYSNNLIADKCYCVINSKPNKKGIEECNRYGIGIIRVNGSVELLLEARQNQVVNFCYKKLAERLGTCEEGIESGIPCRKGMGTTHTIISEIEKYRETNPKATWKELFNNIQNHYSSPQSMASSLYRWRGYTLN